MLGLTFTASSERTVAGCKAGCGSGLTFTTSAERTGTAPAVATVVGARKRGRLKGDDQHTVRDRALGHERLSTAQSVARMVIAACTCFPGNCGDDPHDM